MKKYLNLLLKSSFLVASGASSIAGCTTYLFDVFPTIAFVLLPFSVIYGIYNFDRLVDNTSSLTPERTSVFKTHHRVIKYSVILSWLTTLYLMTVLGKKIALLALLFPLAGVLYVLPVIPAVRYKNLKSIPLLKSFFVPSCWCILVMIGVQFSRASWIESKTLSMLVVVFIRIFLGAYLGDIRDHDIDLKNNILTLHGLLGIKLSHYLMICLHIFSFLLVGILVFTNSLPWTALGLLFPFCIGFVGYFQFRKQFLLNGHIKRTEQLLELYDLEYISYFPSIYIAALLF